MDLGRKQLLESQGYQIIQYPSLDPYWNTDTFLVTPDGKTLADYTNLSQIPVLYDNTQISIDPVAFPYDDLNGYWTARVNGGAILHNQTMGLGEGQLIGTIGWIVIAIIAVASVIAIYFLTHPDQPDPPCGTAPIITDVIPSDCAKIITMPNCDARTYNACTDEWMEENWHNYTPPPNLGDYIQWIIIGAVAIGGIYIAAKVLPGLLRKKEYYYEPQER